MSIFRIPELLDLFMDSLACDKRSLSHCSTVSKTWSTRARYHLFRAITLSIRSPSRSLEMACIFFRSSQTLASHVRHLHVHGGAELRGVKHGRTQQQLNSFWATRHADVHLDVLTAAMRLFPNLLSMDLEKVLPVFMRTHASDRVENYSIPTLRSLVIRDFELRSWHLVYFYSISRLFEHLEELQIFGVTSQCSGISPIIDPAGGLVMRKLQLHGPATMLQLWSDLRAFCEVSDLDVSITAVQRYRSYPGFERILSNVQCLTLRETGKFRVRMSSEAPGAVSPSASLWPRLREIKFFSLGTSSLQMPAGLFRNNVEFILGCLPSGVRRVTVALLKLEDAEMRTTLEQWDWTEIHRIITENFTEFQKLTIAVLPQNRLDADAEDMPLAWRPLVLDKFPSDFSDRLEFGC